MKINFAEILDRIVDAVVKRIEGSEDPRRRYDYLVKLDDKTVKSLANLSESQVDSVAESSFLGVTFPSMLPLKRFAQEVAVWSPSKGGKRAEQLTATMISQETHVVPTLLDKVSGKEKQKEKEKE